MLNFWPIFKLTVFIEMQIAKTVGWFMLSWKFLHSNSLVKTLTKTVQWDIFIKIVHECWIHVQIVTRKITISQINPNLLYDRHYTYSNIPFFPTSEPLRPLCFLAFTVKEMNLFQSFKSIKITSQIKISSICRGVVEDTESLKKTNDLGQANWQT